MRSPYLRGLVVWFLIIAAETIHGIARTALLSPTIGDLRARQVSVFTGVAIIFTVAYLTTGWVGARRIKELLRIGLMWVALTILFEVALGRLVLGLDWERITEDYDISRGGLLGFGMLFLLFAPLVAVRVKDAVNRGK